MTFKAVDVVELFIGIASNLKKRGLSCSSLERLVLKASLGNLAYADNRRDAKKAGFDFWKGIGNQKLKNLEVEKILYTKSESFPDFLMKTKIKGSELISGSLIELKDSKSSNIASFNSTLPTKLKSLEEIDAINNNCMVSRIASVKDGRISQLEDYFSYQRHCFYLVRTNKSKKGVKISLVDGSFFETLPKETLFYQMFMNVLRGHQIPEEIIKKAEEALSYIKDQKIIAASQVIDRASVRPRLRVMAEVHPEGNPHSSEFYPEIPEQSFNLILKLLPGYERIETRIKKEVPQIRVFNIRHKRNGEHVVFSKSLA